MQDRRGSPRPAAQHSLVNMWHTLEPHDVAARLQADIAHGLTDQEAARRLARYGPNELQTYGAKSRRQILREQLTGTMVAMLIAAAAVSAALGDYKDTVAILAIVALNTILGFTQEYRAEQAMVALRRLAVPDSQGSTRRPGPGHPGAPPGRRRHRAAGGGEPRAGRPPRPRRGPPAHPGSLADRRIGAGRTRRPGPLSTRTCPSATGATWPTWERSSPTGAGVGVVAETGMRTELGRIATMIQTVGAEPTPLQRRMDQLGRRWARQRWSSLLPSSWSGLLRGRGCQADVPDGSQPRRGRRAGGLAGRRHHRPVSGRAAHAQTPGARSASCPPSRRWDRSRSSARTRPAR